MEIRTILLPTDFSECGNYALSYAASLARTFKASIICVNVIEPIVPTVGYSGMTEPMPIADITEQLEDSAERELPKLAECDECSGLDVEELVVHGEEAPFVLVLVVEGVAGLETLMILNWLELAPVITYAYWPLGPTSTFLPVEPISHPPELRSVADVLPVFRL